jgi:signal peptidase I
VLRRRGGTLVVSAGRGRALVRAAWTAAIALLALLVLKLFVCDVKRVESGSMEPTIFGSTSAGESVLVLYGAFEPKRFDYVVVVREGDPVPLVKRVVGLPKESVQLAGGDLLIDGKRLPADAPRPPPILVYDSRLASAEGAFEPAHGREGLWTESGGGWRVDAREIALFSNDGLQHMRRPLTDGYLAPDGTLVRGSIDVADAIVECEVLPEQAGGRLLLDLAEQGDIFRFALEWKSPWLATASITRMRHAVQDEILASKEVAVATGSWTHVRCSNVDNGLAFEIAGAEPICCGYDENVFEENDHLKEGKTFGARVRFGGQAGAFSFRALRILRDLHYTGRGTHGISAPEDLGPDEYFVLGDNSATSRDSREWGPIHASWIVGRPIAVVWPPSRIRWLPAAVPGPCGR